MYANNLQSFINRHGNNIFNRMRFSSLIDMKTFLINFLLAASLLLRSINSETFTFPENFKFGAASAAYQIEGGWNEDGKSASIWDTFTHEHPGVIVDGSNSDVSADSYHLYNEDIKVLKLVGFHHYRFSISWPRVLTNGTLVNPKGIEYYSKLIDALLENGIEPIATLYHWDLPQHLQNLGGFTNSLIVEYFAHFADVVFKAYGSRVKKWITFNEPYFICVSGYSTGDMAPGVKAPGVGEYLCAHNVLKAHAAAYHLYKQKYYHEQQGQVGISLNSRFFYRKDETVDESLTDKAEEFYLGWFAHPIFSQKGGYPDVMVDEIAEKSRNQGYPWSRLPAFTDEEKIKIAGSADFFGLNYYTSRLTSSMEESSSQPSFEDDVGVKFSIKNCWWRGESEWLYNVPEGLTDLLLWIKNNYDNPKVFILENGFSDAGELDDFKRISYIKGHITAVAKAMRSGCNVIGYTVWSIIDNFEWNNGFSQKFGIFSVNFSSPMKERTPKKSVKFLRKIIADLSVDF